MATLRMILRINGLPSLLNLNLQGNDLCVGVQVLFEGLGRGAAPSLRILNLRQNQIGSDGAEALSAAILRGAMPKLERLHISSNPLGNQGVAALAPGLRSLQSLEVLQLWKTETGDEGVASLVSNLGENEMRALEELDLDYNKVTDKGCVTLVTAIKADLLPGLKYVPLGGVSQDLVCNPATEAAIGAVQHALFQAHVDSYR